MALTLFVRKCFWLRIPAYQIATTVCHKFRQEQLIRKEQLRKRKFVGFLRGY
jgi:hypothetical protein